MESECASNQGLEANIQDEQQRHTFLTDVDIIALRKRLGLSQDKFAATFGFSAKTLRNWEQGIRTPEGPARILLKVIESDPEAVLRALR